MLGIGFALVDPSALGRNPTTATTGASSTATTGGPQPPGASAHIHAQAQH
jgi:hypothetical protein